MQAIYMKRVLEMTHRIALGAIASLILWAQGASAADVPTFASDVAPIVFDNCVSCHRPGQIGPMSLTSYDEVRPWAKQIRKAVVDRSMPPFHADTSIRSYRNDLSLSDAEVETISTWAASGAPMGDASKMPALPEFSADWQTGEPDMVFPAINGFEIPANQENIEYASVSFDTSALTEDIFISSWEIKTQYPEALHHANLWMSPVSFEGVSGGALPNKGLLSGGDYVGSFLPGSQPMQYPEGTAFRIPKGWHLGIQVHYIGLEETVTDNLEFGVHFAEDRVDKIVRVVATDDREMEIPPGDPNYKYGGESKYLKDVDVLSAGVHMHLRGKDYVMEAVPPTGDPIVLASVPKYDFNWQTTYLMAEPVKVPKNSLLRVTAHYDNSADNPNNPDPTQTVTNGPWTDDEMLNSWTHVVLSDELLGYKIEEGRMVGRFPDAKDVPHPRMIQSLPKEVGPGKGDEKFFKEG